MDVSGKLFAVRILFHKDRLIPALEQMADAPSLRIEISSVSAVDVVKNLRKVAQRGFQQQVVMMAFLSLPREVM